MFTDICFGMTGKPYLYREFICDGESDIQDLPTEKDKIAIGSKALIVDTKKVYILNNAREWKEVLDYTSTASGSSGINVDIATVDETKTFLGI